MARVSLIEADQAFLARLEPARRHSTFASYIYAEIRGIKWRPKQYRGLKSTNPGYILQEVSARLQSYIGRASWDTTDYRQWLQAPTDYPDEALRYIKWCLVWEQRSKIEKRGYRWRQYQAYQRDKGAGPSASMEASEDLTPVLDAFARQTYGPFGALEHPWHELLEAYLS